MNHKEINEQKHFEETIQSIQGNREVLTQKFDEVSRRILELQKSGAASDKNLHNLLLILQNQQENLKNTLEKHRAALECPYFGRVDFDDLNENSYETLYIGKNGIARQQDILIVDWRAPAASVYYENEPGHGYYQVPECDPVEIFLHLKRTYHISNGCFGGYYDNDIAPNDELLISYLSQNKDAVLGDIIATIQREQNQIIRQSPFKNTIIQGVAGSGKTTVAMHHLSYLLYNYGKYIQPEECCIIGSNPVLLSYISSGLPELDVHHIQTASMESFFRTYLGKLWKKKFSVIPLGADCRFKCRLSFINELKAYIDTIWQNLLLPKDIVDPELGLLLSADNAMETVERNRHRSVLQVAEIINQRTLAKLDSTLADNKEQLKQKKAQYRHYLTPLKGEADAVTAYRNFITLFQKRHNVLGDTAHNLEKYRFDLYDLAAAAYIYRRLHAPKDFDEFRQIFIDEAQDFGETIYYILHFIMNDCHFMILGDVSQNIRFSTGLNDWETVKKIFLTREEDSFRLLSKSYRNTIEIATLASSVLSKTASGEYHIEPVIRHGNEVQHFSGNETELLAHCRQIIHAAFANSRKTVAVICRTEEEAAHVKTELSKLSLPAAETGHSFSNGLMVLPAALTKGLEFDVVILWKPTKNNYPEDEKNARLLYVAITRALHELYLLGDEEFSSLL